MIKPAQRARCRALAAPQSGIVIPAGGLERWRAYRSQTATLRRDVICFGDSTTYGSTDTPEPNYSWVQRLRDRMAGAGMTVAGKGFFAGDEVAVGYDAPEINGFVAADATFYGYNNVFGYGDGWADCAPAQFYYTHDAGQTLTLQFKGTCFRLWYSQRPECGTFTYTIDGGSPVTVNANGAYESRFVYVDGLSNATHTIVITAGGRTAVALAGMTDLGVALQKHGTNGGTLGGMTTRVNMSWNALGLTWVGALDAPSSPVSALHVASNYAVDTRPPSAGRVKPVLAIMAMGFNDYGRMRTDGSTPESRYAEFRDGMQIFAAWCKAAGCDGIVCSGQMPGWNDWPTLGPPVYAAMRDTAITNGLGFVDLWTPIAQYFGLPGFPVPHLPRYGYEAQADWLWDNVLSK